MKRTLWSRIKWDNVLLLTFTLAVVATGAWSVVQRKPVFDYSLVEPNDVVTYSYRVQSGDTLWDVASNVATPNEDVREIVFKIMNENNIKNAQELNVGDRIYIHLERVK